MEVNMDDLKCKLEVLESSLINEKKRVGDLNLKNVDSGYPSRIHVEGQKIHAPSNEEPGWAKSLENVLENSTSKIDELQKEVFRLSERITLHISKTNARLDKLEEMSK